ncbi:Cdc25 phosphatase Ibp1 [Tilletia horrida]|nr:Cdc25 phosphatase Ibp1 [Tilletia horrida]
MSFTPLYTYIDARTLAERIKAGDVADRKIAVVDVRDSDFEGGSIVGARNVPSTNFQDQVDSLVKDLFEVPQVVFHCHLSQQRGPKAARIYAEARQQALASGAIKPSSSSSSSPDAKASAAEPAQAQDPTPAQKVIVLRDGAAGFVRQFNDDKTLVENYDAESWAYRE